LISPLRAWVHAHNLNNRHNIKHVGNNDLSGVARNTESRFYPLLKSLPGKILMSWACQLQDWSAGQDWGTGYLVLARRSKPDH
jgi:hypothetical protein